MGNAAFRNSCALFRKEEGCGFDYDKNKDKLSTGANYRQKSKTKKQRHTVYQINRRKNKETVGNITQPICYYKKMTFEVKTLKEKYMQKPNKCYVFNEFSLQP